MSKYDWEALKAEWLQSNESLNQFRIRKKIGNAKSFYHHTNVDQWTDLKKKIATQVTKKIVDKQVKQNVIDWSKYEKAQDGIMAQIYALINKTTKDGKVDKAMPARDVAQLSQALNNLSKNKSFMNGGPTERIDQRTLHADLTDDLNKRLEE